MRVKPTAIRKTLSSIAFIAALLASCTKGTEEKKENRPPEAFTVSVSNATTTGATLNWTVAKDPENGKVTYSVELNSQSTATGLSATTHTLQSLTPNTRYAGKVTATDDMGAKTTADFSFSTSDTPPPSDFTVRLDSFSNKSVSLFWTASTLAGGGSVSYDVYVNGTMKVSGIFETKYTVSGLAPATSYPVKVVAKSPDGKSTEKPATYQTKANTAPAAFTISETGHGFSYIAVSGTAIVDDDKDALTYYLVKNDVETPIASLPNAATSFNYLASQLDANHAYTVAIRVRDEFGATATSNSVSATTHHRPVNPTISMDRDGSKVVVRWENSTHDRFDIGSSRYYIDGHSKPLAEAARMVTTVQADNKTSSKLTIDASEFAAGTAQDIKVSLNWGSANNSYITNSNVVRYTYNMYSPTTAVVGTAKIKGPGTYPPQFTITFPNCFISEYSSWDIDEIKFDNVTIQGHLGVPFCEFQKPGYYTGNVTAAEYTYLKTKNTGYLIVKDAGGLHKIDFTYTTED